MALSVGLDMYILSPSRPSVFDRWGLSSDVFDCTYFHLVDLQCLTDGINDQTVSTCTYFHLVDSQCLTDGVNRQMVSTCTYFHLVDFQCLTDGVNVQMVFVHKLNGVLDITCRTKTDNTAPTPAGKRSPLRFRNQLITRDGSIIVR